MISIVQMKKLRHREVNMLVPSHTATSWWQNQGSNLESLVSDLTWTLPLLVEWAMSLPRWLGAVPIEACRATRHSIVRVTELYLGSSNPSAAEGVGLTLGCFPVACFPPWGCLVYYCYCHMTFCASLRNILLPFPASNLQLT
jgi:hypothetical protein